MLRDREVGTYVYRKWLSLSTYVGFHHRMCLYWDYTLIGSYYDCIQNRKCIENQYGL